MQMIKELLECDPKTYEAINIAMRSSPSGKGHLVFPGVGFPAADNNKLSDVMPVSFLNAQSYRETTKGVKHVTILRYGYVLKTGQTVVCTHLPNIRTYLGSRKLTDTNKVRYRVANNMTHLIEYKVTLDDDQTDENGVYQHIRETTLTVYTA